MTVRKQLESIEGKRARAAALKNMPFACADAKACNVNTAAMICLMHSFDADKKQYWYKFLDPQ